MNKTKTETIQVKISDYQLAQPSQILKTTGLGSCIGVVIYHPSKQVAGMAHVMLPSSKLSKGSTFNLAKYADTAIPEMVNEMKQTFKVSPTQLIAKMAGGAQMFQFTGKSEALRVGPRNAEAVKEALEILKIPLVAEDVGGQNGRTIEFNTDDNMLSIRTIHKGITTI
ncbi:chemotaxis protein CheD [Pseudalkalibacillus berkeleyi]|uniref:Probable chemoreceptor glutamine deamidase CheD n=1 Tax=Pseudalkalibacillus berkeleyi TaxID=1069813 RepID=A0ABS9GZ90_9BACL|nr:chemotaxis protein CheD [Pseudalkalibacillus berkeleyi]MCF6137131.1 chemotaxis protein CheD [Pseudalkalibacillus berkeleyi]